MGSDATSPEVSSRSSFRRFYDDEVDVQVRRAALIIGDDQEAHDVVHDAFVQVYGRWARLAEPGPYLNRCVLNGCRDVFRRTRRTAAVLPRLVDTSRGAPAEVLWDVVAALPFNERAAVVLRYYGDFSHAEIAASLGCPPGSVGPWIRRALDRMKEALT